MEIKRLRFKYVNWHGEEHEYVVAPSTVTYQEGYHEVDVKSFAWVLNCQVIKRDGEDRPSIRSFVISKMTDIEEVSA